MKNRYFQSLLLFYFFAVLKAPFGLVAEDTESTRLFSELESKMALFQTSVLPFKQERHLRLFAKPMVTEGVMVMAKPDKIRWEIVQPYQSILIGDRKSVAQFEKTGDRWKKLHSGFSKQLQKLLEQMVLVHRGNLSELSKEYDIRISQDDRIRLVMSPLDPAVSGFVKSITVQMNLDFSVTEQVSMLEPNGDKTVILFTREIRNVSLPDRTFDKTRPIDIASVTSLVHDVP